MTIRPIIGLEIHVQLATRTKMFCPCAVEFAAEPNSRVCPVCLGMPGTLPVMNRAAYELAVRAAVALNCKIAPFTKWDRKSYYYPDMPKNYQISQYDLPLSSEGWFELPIEEPRPSGRATALLPTGCATPSSVKLIGIIRAHLEEDAGKSLHEGLAYTRVDLNRAGTPLLEIVTRPDLESAEDAYAFCVQLQRLVRYLGISEANMQRGQMRFEPNVNVAITENGVEYRTPISEIKNLNSFRSVRDAIAFEIDRQVRAWQADHDYTLEKVGKLNFGWDDERGVTEFQRGKEESHDYRYFPDPDLVPVTNDPSWIDAVRREVGELPLQAERRFIRDYGMTAKDCEVILADRRTANLFDAAIAAGASAKTLTKQFVGIWNHLASARNVTIGELGVPASIVAELAKLVDAGQISASAAAQVAEALGGTGVPLNKGGTGVPLNKGGTGVPLNKGGTGVPLNKGGTGVLLNKGGTGVPLNKGGTGVPPVSNGQDARTTRDGVGAPVPTSALDVAGRLGVLQVRDESATAAWVDQAFAENPQAVADALGTNERKAKAAPGFLRGQVMKISQGKADPKLVGEIIERKLNELRMANSE